MMSNFFCSIHEIFNTIFGNCNSHLMWSVAMFISWSLYFTLACFDLGLGILFRWIKRNKIKNIIIKKLEPIWIAHQLLLIIATTTLFVNFQHIFEAFCFIFKNFTIGLLLIFVLRKILHNIRDKISHQYTRNIVEFLIADSCFMILLLFGSLLSGIFSGIPFYYNKNNIIISFFQMQDLFNWNTLIIQITLLLSSITLGAVYLNFKIKSMKRISLFASVSLLAIMIVSLPLTLYTNTPWLHTTFNANWLYLAPIFLQIASISSIFLKNFKFAFILNIISMLNLSWVFISSIYPYALPSKLELEQSVSIDHTTNFIDISLLPIILISCLSIFFIAFFVKIVQEKKIILNKELLNFLICICSILAIFYFLDLDALNSLSTFLDQI